MIEKLRSFGNHVGSNKGFYFGVLSAGIVTASILWSGRAISWLKTGFFSFPSPRTPLGNTKKPNVNKQAESVPEQAIKVCYKTLDQCYKSVIDHADKDPSTDVIFSLMIGLCEKLPLNFDQDKSGQADIEQINFCLEHVKTKILLIERDERTQQGFTYLVEKANILLNGAAGFRSKNITSYDSVPSLTAVKFPAPANLPKDFPKQTDGKYWLNPNCVLKVICKDTTEADVIIVRASNEIKRNNLDDYHVWFCLDSTWYCSTYTQRIYNSSGIEIKEFGGEDVEDFIEKAINQAKPIFSKSNNTIFERLKSLDF